MCSDLSCILSKSVLARRERAREKARERERERERERDPQTREALKI